MNNYWWLCANPKEWDFFQIAEGEIKAFSNKTPSGKMRANFAAAQVGDKVIGYEAWPQMKALALLEVCGKDATHLHFKKLADARTPASYQYLRGCPALADMSFFRWSSGTLFSLKESEYKMIAAIISKKMSQPEPYGKAQFLDEVFMEGADYDKLAALLVYKKNIILQGAPGVGKTHTAKRLACAIMGEKDASRIESVQFHQNYCYEDFIMGYRPSPGGFSLEEGIFYRFCRKAAAQPDKPFFFIVDEINRGNMSKIFGELLQLIEKDYRGEPMKLAYERDNVSFSVPENLYIIGMMNTADRSLAMIDYALRRRFAFVDMEPAFEVDSFKAWLKGLGSEVAIRLMDTVKELNKAITDDPVLGAGFCIGHSYFCGLKAGNTLPEQLNMIVRHEILPMLREYWFDAPKKVKDWEKALLEALT